MIYYMKNKILIILLIVIVFIIIINFNKEEEGIEKEPIGLPNPASVYCQEIGGESKIKDFPTGQKGFCFFEDNSRCEEWNLYNGNCQPGQLIIETLEAGEGKLANSGDILTVHYVGTLLDGTKFDSSIDRNQPFSFKLGQGLVIQGWEQGILGMQVGELRKLTINSDLAYGERGSGNIIGPGDNLVFEVELLEIK